MNILIALFIIISCGINAEHRVRVLLAELPDTSAVHFKAAQGFVVGDAKGETVTVEVPEQSLIITAKNGKLYLNDKCCSIPHLRIDSPHGDITFNENAYGGFFYVVVCCNSILVINSIELEEYVGCVLRWESWPGWPIEVNKAFAITCRTYAVSLLLENRTSKKKKLYDIKATNIHQTYKGSHTLEIIDQAIQETEGIIMVYNDKPIRAMYDSCCGGVVPAHLQSLQNVDVPYLKRPYACNYCQNAKKLYSWKARYTIAELEQLLSEMFGKKYTIKKLGKVNYDKAGIVTSVSFHTNRGALTLTGKQMYSLCKDIKSMCYKITIENNVLTLSEGKGFGHHKGLCQWGTRQLEREGWSADEMLLFYYPGISFKKIGFVHATV
jgi:stage II sporulation protein D